MKFDDVESAIEEQMKDIRELETIYKCEDADLSLIGKAISDRAIAEKKAAKRLQAFVAIIGLVSIVLLAVMTK